MWAPLSPEGKIIRRMLRTPAFSTGCVSVFAAAENECLLRAEMGLCCHCTVALGTVSSSLQPVPWLEASQSAMPRDTETT